MAKIMEELIKGIDLTKQLQTLIQKPFSPNMELLRQKELVDKIHGSLTEAISVMSSSSSSENSGEVSPNFSYWGSADSGQSRKRPAVKDGRGDYKRRKSPDSWINVKSTWVDEYSWRKYGQKETHNAAYPRCYFRCTHKDDQGCKATKQVQRIQQEPIKYQITYFGNHTCRKTLQPNLENTVLDFYLENSNIISFESYTPSEKDPSPPWTNLVKEGNKEEKSDPTREESFQSDSIIWPDLTSLMRSDINQGFLPSTYSYASSVAYQGMDIDFFPECDDFASWFESIC